jgi:sugar lactone lactonase YvrE
VRAEQITDSVNYHGEGPVWFPGGGGLHWVDMLAGDVLSLRADGTITRLITRRPSDVMGYRPLSPGISC